MAVLLTSALAACAPTVATGDGPGTPADHPVAAAPSAVSEGVAFADVPASPPSPPTSPGAAFVCYVGQPCNPPLSAWTVSTGCTSVWRAAMHRSTCPAGQPVLP